MSVLFKTGFGGDTCNKSICTATSCQNGGLCRNDQCDCDGTGYTGRSCGTKIDFCHNVTCGPGELCSNDIFNYTCTCLDGRRCLHYKSTQNKVNHAKIGASVKVYYILHVIQHYVALF